MEARLVELGAELDHTEDRALADRAALDRLPLGMNVGGIPWAQEREGFWIAVGFCLALFGASYWMLRRFRILP